jgi:signal transduction histidine kinase
VCGDPELLVRLLCHLLRAALAAGATAIEVESFHEDGLVRVELRDDGAPASEDPFAPFARGRGRGPLVGAGVGLTVSRRIVELHGGAITIDRDADGGAVSSFTLPGQ